jgi:hypothetical protein
MLCFLLAAPILGLPPTPRGPAKAVSAAPVFQAVGLFGDLVVMNATGLLSVATYLAPDNGSFGLAFFITGLARDPVSGQVYVLGNDFLDSYLGRVDFATGTVASVATIPGEVFTDLAMDGAGQLYGLTDNGSGTTPHALFRIDKATGAAALAKALDAHGGNSSDGQFGAIAWNPADQSLYYADLNNDSPHRHLFIDKLAPGTFAQSPVTTTTFNLSPYAMAFAAGRLWLSTNGFFYSADALNIGAGFTNEGFTSFPSPDGTLQFLASGMFPAVLPCVPGPTVACVANRFKVEVSYDATPANGAGPATVVLESGKSVKFSFFDPANIELILKVLDACSPPFNKWWVFGGGLTNVGVTIRVTDTTTGAMKTYTNPKGTLFKSFADTTAFGCP